jgi:1,2-diacylglycerol 3-beta-glucosyltransferase
VKRIACAVGVICVLTLACDATSVYAAGWQRQFAVASARGPSAFAPDDFGSRPVALGAGYWRDGGSARVRAAQRRLRAARFSPGPIDGRFGPRTERATRRFQRASGLTVDGIVGTRTFRALAAGGAARPARAPRRPHAPPRAVPSSRSDRPTIERRHATAPEPSSPGVGASVWWIVLVGGGVLLAVGAPVGRALARRRRLRALPLDSRRKSLVAALLSVVAIALLVLYLVVPPVEGRCGPHCGPSWWLQLIYNVAACTVLAITLYFLVLCLVGLCVMHRAPRGPMRWRPVFVLVIPARDEELVIGHTVRRLLELSYDRLLVMVMNDGSSDDTSATARAAADGDRRLVVIDRPAEIAGVGKGDVLNHAYRVIREMIWSHDPRLAGAGTAEVVLGVVDADGWLQPNALEAVAPYYDDPRVAGVQVPVRMYNARAGFLAFMQDVEFIGYSLLVQGGRDPVGSVGLGGNGQFIRVSALASLGAQPWTKSLVEDLDIGLTLVKRGWRNRMCPHTHVAQQAVTTPRRLLRQRTRWVQGHFTCWAHLPSLWRARSVPVVTRCDLSLHLFLAVAVLLGALQAVLGLVGFLGLYPLRRSVIAEVLDNDTLYRLSVVALACGPLTLLSLAYQRAAVRYQGSPQLRLPLWSLPGMLLVYTSYTYLWGIPCSLRAFARLITRRTNWAKTARDPIAAKTASAAEGRAP